MPNEETKPGWVTETPHTEHLTQGLLSLIGDDEGMGIQDIDLTRDEYLALKAHLAKLRGYVIPEESNAETKS